jgi:hypothetical protein
MAVFACEKGSAIGCSMTFKLVTTAMGLLFSCACCLCAATVTLEIGASHWVDNTTVGTGTFNAAVAGQPAPFDQFYGSDVSGSNFSNSWTYSGPAIAGTITAATFSVGIDDSDAATAGDQVASFVLGGIDLTASLNTAFNSHGGASGKYNIYLITLPSSTFAALATGTPTLGLTLQNGGGILGPTDFNGAGIDFAEIDITAATPGTVPEPSVLALLLTGIVVFPIRRMVARRLRA